MKFYKLALPAAILVAILFSVDGTDTSWTEAQAATPSSESIPARDAVTSREDITLTNSCIESGKEKLYCLCVTKIFKNEMTLREYRGAVALYGKQNITNAQTVLENQGYSADEVSSISTLKHELASEDKFRTRCHLAETYFAAATES